MDKPSALEAVVEKNRRSQIAALGVIIVPQEGVRSSILFSFTEPFRGCEFAALAAATFCIYVEFLKGMSIRETIMYITSLFMRKPTGNFLSYVEKYREIFFL